ncbi:SPOR domain-containing protein [Massilia sp. PWRC2]|uniref:SPOR domain-containing protein n=1 Tax=Massilia sp. PWRC2 TaxID=2804626 RepID=UPI003CE9B6FA
MLKFALWFLLALNAALLAYSQGLLGYGGEEHEPARLQNQLNRGALRLLPAATAAPVTAAATAPAESTAPAPEPAPAPATTIACIEVGSFGAAEGRRFENRLAALKLGQHVKRFALESADPTSYIVYIPAQANKEAAERKASELKSLGVSDYFIMNDASPMKNAISLGVFKSETLAQTLLATLVKQGVHSARILPRGGVPARLAFQFRDIDTVERDRIAELAGSFQDVANKACK